MKKSKYKISFILVFILSILLILISFFWIPIISGFNIKIPYILLWFQIPIIAVATLPFAICVLKIKNKK